MEQNAGDSRRRPSELLKRGYSEEEIANIYELGRFFCENGDLRGAEVIFNGVSAIAPDFMPAWLGKCCLYMQSQNYDQAVAAAQQALRVEPDSILAMLYLTTALLSVGDYNSAGTYLGEISDRLGGPNSADIHPDVIRFFKMQLARFQTRKK